MAILYRSSPDISSRFGRSLHDGTGREAAQPMVASDRVLNRPGIVGGPNS